jgi:hypothetical protein
MAVNAVGIKGFDKVMANLNKEIAGLKTRTKSGMIKAGLFIKGESMRLVPVDLNNLRSSAFVDWNWGTGGNVGSPGFKGKYAEQIESGHSTTISEEKGALQNTKNLAVCIGYTAYYAVYVHEINKNYTVGQWQYLRDPLVTNHQKILDMIAGEARIK